MKFLAYALVGALSAAAGAAAMYFWIEPPSRYQGDARAVSLDKLAPREAADQFLPAMADRLSDRVIAFSVGGGVESHQAMDEAIADSISFRLRADAFSFGLCLADNLRVDLETVRIGPSSTTVRPEGHIGIRQTYHVVGDTTPNRPWTETYEAELDKSCAALGADTIFFGFGAGSEPDTRALTDMLPALRNLAATVDVGCSGNDEACRSPREVVAGLDPKRLVMVSSIFECAEFDQTCLELVYLAERDAGLAPNREAGRDSEVIGRPPLWVVKAKGNYRGTYSTGMGKLVLSEVQISYN